MPYSVKKPLVIGVDNKVRVLADDEYLDRTHVQIPQPILRVGQFNPVIGYNPLHVSIEPTHDLSYKQLNPRLWFFRLRRSSRKRYYDPLRNDRVTKRVPQKWVHPTNHGSTGIRFSSGEEILQYAGLTKWPLETEWEISAMASYKYLPISFNPLQFYRGDGTNHLQVSDLPIVAGGIKVAGIRGGSSRKAKIVYGLFRVVIDDYTDPQQDANKTVLFGPPSELFTLRPLISDRKCTGIQITLAVGNIKLK